MLHDGRNAGIPTKAQRCDLDQVMSKVRKIFDVILIRTTILRFSGRGAYTIFKSCLPWLSVGMELSRSNCAAPVSLKWKFVLEEREVQPEHELELRGRRSIVHRLVSRKQTRLYWSGTDSKTEVDRDNGFT
jgi:hypothetical protein